MPDAPANKVTRPDSTSAQQRELLTRKMAPRRYPERIHMQDSLRGTKAGTNADPTKVNKSLRKLLPTRT